jgi:hypothetical protein
MASSMKALPKLAGALLSTLAAFVLSSGAAAHTTSLGFTPGTTAGSVIIWTGSYSHGGTPVNEGTGTLTGISVSYNQSQAFNIGPVATKPAGLIDGTNNFFWGNAVGGVYPFPLSVDPVLFGGVVAWQGTQFSGLVPGTYSFTCGNNCGVTAQWQSLNTGANEAVTITLTSGVIGGGSADIPTLSEWGLIITMLLLATAAAYTIRRRG